MPISMAAMDAAGFLLVFVFLPLCRAASPDAEAMQKLASSFHPRPRGWSATSDPCEEKWRGVSCSSSSRVTSISLPSLSLSGTLPSTALASLTSLRLISIHHNALSGPLPSLPSPLPSLQELYLHDNNFTSLSATFFSSFPNLVNLSIDRNPLSPWPLPSSSSISPHLISFSASNSGASGPLPASLASLPGLTSLRLSYNSLSGPIPADSFHASNLRELSLNNQDPKLSVSIAFLASLTQLQTAMVHSNNFTGPIPDLSGLTALRVLLLRDNRLTGPVPPSLPATLRRVSLSHNLLQGPFPAFDSGVWEDAGRDGGGNSFCSNKPAAACDSRVTAMLEVAGGFGYPLEIASSWKGSDPCAQWMFVNCDPQGNVKVLNFAGQQFGGTISPAIADVATLEKVILSDNNLTGRIPSGLAKMPMLQLLDVSNNNLSGKIPSFQSGVLKYASNPFLGKELGDGDGKSSSETSGSQEGPSHSHSWVWIAIVAAMAMVVVTAAALFFYRRKNRRSPRGGKPKKARLNSRKRPVERGSMGSAGDTCIVDPEAVVMPLREIEQATGAFSEEKILGRGGFGVVYKGELPDGTLIAVKRMECGHMGKKGMTEFHAEIAVLTKVRHRHLVALLGYCVEGNERILVYEYMAEGTLGDHLFDHGNTGHAYLSWKQRLTIALDVARGLEYLHSLAHRSFIHRDLKPSNILLDGDMRAKVSDFGLVKLAPDEHSVQTRLAGTFGYLAPEYATTGKVTTKIDVYAFGVVLMELICGRKALDDSLPDEHVHLVTWFQRVLVDRNNFDKCVDSNLDLNEDDMKSVAVASELAGHCAVREAHRRPDMGHVVNILAPLVDQWKPSSSNYGDSFSNVFKPGGIMSVINAQSTTDFQS